MNESFSEQKKVVSIGHAFEIQKKERSKEKHAIMQELEKRVPLLFAAENELISARKYARALRLSHGAADNAPHAEDISNDDDGMSEHIEKLIDEVAYLKSEMQELLDKMRILEEEKKALIDRAEHFGSRHQDDK